MTKVADNGMESTHIHISDMKVLMEELAKVYKHMQGCGEDAAMPSSLHLVAKLVPQLGKEAWEALCAKAPSMGWCALECSFDDGHMHVHVPLSPEQGSEEREGTHVQDSQRQGKQGTSSQSDKLSVVDTLLYSLLDVPFIKQLEQEVARAARGNTALAVVRLAFQGRISNGKCTEDFSQMVGADVLDEMLRDEGFSEHGAAFIKDKATMHSQVSYEEAQKKEGVLFSSDVIKLVQNALQIHACSCDTLGVYQGEMILILPGAKIFAAQNLVEDILFYCKQQGYLLCAGIAGHMGAHCTVSALLEQSVSALNDAVEQKVAVRLYRENMHALDARRTLVQSHEKRFLFGAV